MALRLYDGFETKSQAEKVADGLRKDKRRPQYVSVKQIGQGRLKRGVYVGGTNSTMWA